MIFTTALILGFVGVNLNNGIFAPKANHESLEASQDEDSELGEASNTKPLTKRTTKPKSGFPGRRIGAGTR